jgi:hypothetical protein
VLREEGGQRRVSKQLREYFEETEELIIEMCVKGT